MSFKVRFQVNYPLDSQVFLATKENSSSTVNYKNAREHVAAILSTTTTYIPSDDPAVLFQVLVDVEKYAPEGTPESGAPGEKEGVLVNLNVVDPLKRLTLHSTTPGHDGNHYRYFGKSSSRSFLIDIMDMKIFNESTNKQTFNAQRPEFWDPKPWHDMVEEAIPPQSFPEDDLLTSLIDLYFERINPLMGLLHAPSFRRSISQESISVTSILAPSFYWSVLSPPDVQTTLEFYWIKSPTRAVPAGNGSGNDLCAFAFSDPLSMMDRHTQLSALFVAQTPSPRACWVLSGVGIRIAQEIGAHRRGRYLVGSRFDAELLRRAFWMLLSLDTILSSLLGRPPATRPEDFDVDLPIACDDEYWEGTQPFQQPADKPSIAAYLPPYLELMMLFNRVQRAIYPVKKHESCPAEVIAELDSALNKWLDSIPTHLRWDPNLKGIFLDQSASLYAAYYNVQILIHRPFIPPSGAVPTAPSIFPSLAICANSARSCGHVVEAHSRRAGHVLYQPHVITVLFDSAVILLMNVWGTRPEKLSPVDIARAKADIKKCVDVLGLYEKIWATAGRKRDMITEVLDRSSDRRHEATAYVPSAAPPAPLKRGRDAYVVAEDHSGAQWIQPESPGTVQEQLEQLERSIQETDHLFSLPISTEELGLLPVHESFDFPYDVHSAHSGFHHGEYVDAGYAGAVPVEQPYYGDVQGWQYTDHSSTGVGDPQDWVRYADTGVLHGHDGRYPLS
ncbi:fungal-specific transcription factor domain-containing protein [Roridomyces roridus]|uniref:Fungal-specific transcription factor domain-containing protein n=1 Tax=Roridomyces roridus TaxID=1738132 RepID=A0AAD7FGG6_9AGAR|nr:fungal-specific transcription factor domain-containing protein [Roridomyces roridus]